MNSNTFTLSQAHKIYTGDGIVPYAFKLGIAGILMYSATIITFFLIMLLSKGNASDAMKELSRSAVINTILTIDAGIILMITGLMHYDKQLPGGKYFRTLKGGFDTYRKMKNASLIARVIALILIMAFAAFIDILGLFKLANGIIDVVYIGAFLLISIGSVNYMSLIKNPVAAGFICPFIILAVGILGVMLPSASDGNIYFALVITAYAIPFITTSQKVMLNNYKKNKWNK